MIDVNKIILDDLPSIGIDEFEELYLGDPDFDPHWNNFKHYEVLSRKKVDLIIVNHYVLSLVKSKHFEPLLVISLLEDALETNTEYFITAMYQASVNSGDATFVEDYLHDLLCKRILGGEDLGFLFRMFLNNNRDHIKHNSISHNLKVSGRESDMESPLTEFDYEGVEFHF
jgi:hypothetical protein